MNPPKDNPSTITDNELASYVVCPEAWRLKRMEGGKISQSERRQESQQLRKDIVAQEDLSVLLRRYAKISYLLLVMLVIVIFLLEHYRGIINLKDRFGFNPASKWFNHEFSNIPLEIFLLLIVLGFIIFLWDFFDRHSRKLQSLSGFSKKSELLALTGSNLLPGMQYQSPSKGLASRPDALMKEGGKIIPVNIHPLGNKIKDRHVVPLLLHMKLIAEHEGIAPDYGILLMGADKRQVKVKNTEDKQRWLQTLIDEMRSIENGVPAVPAPSFYKCKNCDVRKLCSSSAFKPQK